jgi:hypothetical protein
METAWKVDAALKPISDEEASFMVRYRSEIESILSQGSTSSRVGESIFAKNLEDVKNSLKQIET